MKIYVTKQNVAIGYLEETVFGEISFVYLESIEPEAYIPGLTEKVNHSSSGLFTVFNNFLPENNQVDLLKQKFKIQSNIEVLLYLENIHGSYEFTHEDNFVLQETSISKIINYADIRKDVLNNDYTYPNILEDYEININDDFMFPSGIENSNVIGLSGFQYKFSVDIDYDKKVIGKGRGPKNEYFIKPYSKYYTTFAPKERDRLYLPYLLINEHMFMSMARDLGFDVPYNAIIKQEYDYHYIIKRFDRYKGFSFDHEEFATLMGIDSDKKYTPTLRQVFKKAKEYLDSDKIYELMKFFIFSIVISHGDLHSKNISLINNSNSLSETKKSLSPYYDISTTNIYKGIDKKDIGMKLNSKTSNIKREDIIEFAKSIELDENEINTIIDEVCNYFIDNFKNRYIALLPANIKALPFYKSTYGKPDSFESMLNKYYERKCALIGTHFGIKKEEEFF